MSRTSQILQLCLKALDDEGERKVTRDELLYHLNAVQRNICRDIPVLQKDVVLNILAGKPRYETNEPIAQIKTIRSSWGEKVTIITDPNEWIAITKRQGYRLERDLFVYRWDDALEIFPPAESGTLTIKATLFPNSIDTLDDDPDLPMDYDKALRFGTLAEIGDTSWNEKYLAEMSVLGQRFITQTPIKIASRYERLGF